MSILRWIVGGVAVIVLSSCRVLIENPAPAGSEGRISLSGVVKASNINWTCPDYARYCVFDVTDFYFDETFVAIPKEGYRFKHWKKGERRLCGGSNKPCRVSTTIFTGGWIPVVQGFLDDPNETFYIEPVFEKIGSTGGSCSVYLGSSPFCNQGKLPTCEVTRAQGFEISAGMTYEQVVLKLGCHGALSKTLNLGNVILADYTWSVFTKIPYVTIIVGFESRNGGIPKVARVGIY